MREPITIVTVVFKSEIEMMKLQARSFRRHLHVDEVTKIFVIIQGNDHSSRNRVLDLVPEYGGLADKVCVVMEAEVAAVPRAEGWVAQQILKLKIAEQVKSRRYLVLDGKSHLRAPLSDAFLYDGDRVRVKVYPYHEHGLRDRLETSLRYFGLDTSYIDRFASSVPPIMLDREIACALIVEVEQRSGRSFEEEFVKAGLTEFFLYYAFVIARYGSLEELYALDAVHSATVFENKTSSSAVDAELTRGRHSPVMSVHRRSYIKLDRAAAHRIAQAWCDGGIFDTEADGLRFIRHYRRSYFPSFMQEFVRRRMYKLVRA